MDDFGNAVEIEDTVDSFAVMNVVAKYPQLQRFLSSIGGRQTDG
jgi:hypothetical protein